MNGYRLGLCVLGLITCILAAPFTARADDCGCKQSGEWTAPDGCMTLPVKPCNWDAACGCAKCAQPCAEPCATPCETACKPDCAEPCGKCPKCSEFPQTGAPEGFHEVPLPDALSSGVNLDCCCPRAEYELLCGCGQEYTMCPWPADFELLCLPSKPCKPCKAKCKQDTCTPDGCGQHHGESVEWDN